MKKLLSTLFVISTLFAAAQTPQGINYQSIIRNTSGVVLPSTAVTVEFKLYSNLSPTTLLYDETHAATTNSFGMVNLVIGQGTVIGGVVAFNSIPWVSGIQYEVWVNSALVGTRQPFMSVPYALHAATASAAPAPSVTFSNNILSVGGNTVSITTGPTYTAGTGIAISGNTISNNAPDQTVSVTGLGSATVTGVYPNFSIETPSVSAAATPTIVGAGSATVTSAGNTFTVDVPVSATPSITGTGAANVTSAGNSFTVDVPSSVPPTITGAGSATITSAGNTFTVNTPVAVTPTITNTGIAVVTPASGNAFNVDVPAPVLSYNQGTKELSITQGSAVTTQTLTGTGSNTISIVGSDMATVTPTTGSTFTVSVPTPTLDVIGATLTGTYPTQTLTIPSGSTTLVQGTNVTLNQSGNTYTVSSPSQSLSVNSNSLSITGGNTVTIPTSTVVSGSPNIIVNQSGNTYSVSAVPQTLSIASNSVITLTNGGSVNITPAVLSYTPATNVIRLTDGLSSNTFTLTTPTLALSGSTLTSGAATNSVNLAAIPGLWSASSTTAVVLTNTSNNVGIGVVPASQFKLDVAATAGNSVTIHGINNGSTDAFAAVYGENTSSGIGVYAQSNGGKGVFGKSTSGIGVHGESVTGDAGRFLMTGTGSSFGVQVQTNGTGAALYAKSNYTPNPLAGKFDGHVTIGGKARIDSSLTMASYSVAPAVSIPNEGRIYFDRTLSKFMVSESTGPYKPLFGAAPWVQGAGTTTLTNINDKVGIGTNAPSAALDIKNAAPSLDGLALDMNNATNGSNALQIRHYGIGNLGYFEINNPSSGSRIIQASSNGSGHGVEVILTSPTNASNGVRVQTSGTGGAINAIANTGSGLSATNSSTVAAAIIGTNSQGDAMYGIATNGRAFYGSNNSTSGLSTMELSSNGNGAVLFAYKNTGGSGSTALFSNNESSNPSDAVQVFSNGAGASISSSNTNASPTSYAGVFDGGITTKGKTTTATGYAFRAFNSASTSLLSIRNDAIVEIGANVGINIVNPTNRLHVNSSYANAAIFAENITAVSTASVAHGLQARASSTHSLAAAVFGNNIGTGPSVYGIKSATDNGIAGRFDILSTTNTADAVFAITNGGGAAIHAVNGPTVTGGSNLGLMVENGHIGSTSSSVITASTNASCGCIGSLTMDNHSTDVVGTLRAVFSSTTSLAVDITVTFTKPYRKYPVVMITPTESPNAANSYPKYIVVPVGAAGNYTGFRLTIVGGGVNNNGSYGYNYMVIEGK